MQANAEDDLFGFRTSTIIVGNSLLELDRRRQRIDCACEFDQRAVARQFDQPAAVSRECWLETFPTMLPQARQRAAFVPSHKAGVADNVCGQNRRQFALLTGHGVSPYFYGGS